MAQIKREHVLLVLQGPPGPHGNPGRPGPKGLKVCTAACLLWAVNKSVVDFFLLLL